MLGPLKFQEAPKNVRHDLRVLQSHIGIRIVYVYAKDMHIPAVSNRKMACYVLICLRRR